MAARATRFGRPLPPGGTIGVPAPATPYHNRSEILRGVEWWESKGYRVKLSAGIYERDAWVAGDALARARDLVAMFADPDVDVVQCAQGGYGSAQLIPHVDFDLGRLRDQADRLSPGVEVLPLSVRTGENVEAWYAFLEDVVAQRGGAAHGARVGT